MGPQDHATTDTQGHTYGTLAWYSFEMGMCFPISVILESQHTSGYQFPAYEIRLDIHKAHTRLL